LWSCFFNILVGLIVKEENFLVQNFLILLLMFMILIVANIKLLANGTLPAGSGTEGDPYQIATLDNLLWVSTNSSSWDKYFIQTADIDASATSTWNSDGSGDYYGFSPIGFNDVAFIGTYEGNNHTINHLYIHRPDDDYNAQGLFGLVKGATIKNLGVIAVDITGDGSVGGLIGSGSTYNSSSPLIIDNCYISGSVIGGSNGGSRSGGLIGYTRAFSYNVTITNCYSSCSVSKTSQAGGLIGEARGTSSVTYKISNCYSSGSVTGYYDVGGLVGKCNQYCEVENCYSTADVNGINDRIGGLVGYNYYSTISNCYSKGSVSGGSSVGGLVGDNTSSTVTNSFWDTQTSGQSSSAAGTGKTTSEMKTQSIFTDAGWDFVNESANGNNDYWNIDVDRNRGYPYLSWQTFSEGTAPSSGDGSSGNPYQIAMLDNLLWISAHLSSWGKSFIQTADIDAAATESWNLEEGFSPIGDNVNHFTGVYDGNSHTISSLYINRSGKDYQALFGYTSGATIKKLGVTDVNISGNGFIGGFVGMNENSTSVEHSYTTGNISGSDLEVGGLIGTNNATVSYCYSTCTVNSSNDDVGGLVGCNSGTISCSYASGNVSSTGDDVGGFVGLSFGPSGVEISNCYSTGNVSGSDGVGGFAGESYNPISNSYSTGSVSGSTNLGGFIGYNNTTISNSFWNTETSGQSSSDGGTGKTTAEMQTKSTFTDASWDFVGESTNGDNDYWDIDGSTNNGYPILYSVSSATPVELISFTSKKIGNTILLNWETATEVNNYGFEMQRSVVSSQISEFKTIGFIEGHGNSNSPNDYSFIDSDNLVGVVQYRLKQIDFDGGFEYSDIVEVKSNLPKVYKLNQNYPNPFNPSTTISYALPYDSKVKVEIFNVLGQLVYVIASGVESAGLHSTLWDATHLVSGIYIIRINATSVSSNNNFTKSIKMILMK